MQKHEKCCFGMILTTMTFGPPRVDQGHFGQFDLKWHFKCSDAQIGCTTSIQMFLWPNGEKLIFLEFLWSGTQIEGEQNTVSTITIVIIIIITTIWVGKSSRTINLPRILGHFHLEIPSKPNQLFMLLYSGLNLKMKVLEQVLGEARKEKTR